MNLKNGKIKTRPLLFISVWLVMLFLCVTSGFAQVDFPNTPLTLSYRPGNNIPINYRVAEKDTSWLVFITIAIPVNMNFDQDFNLTYEIKDDYASKTSRLNKTLNFHLHGIGEDQDKKYFQLEVPKDPDHSLLIIRVRNINSDIIFLKDIPLRLSPPYNHPEFYLNLSAPGLPVCDTFVRLNESLTIRDTENEASLFHVFYYDHEFSPADPPMHRLKKNISRTLTVDSVFQVSNDQIFSLTQTGLYFIQSDTTTLTGLTIRVENPYYPKLVSMADLIDAAIYLTTRQELNKLKDTGDLRKSFEKFWLNLARSENEGKRMIDSYYDRIERANEYFTTYKPGWKTDMGMIYTIIGNPDEVYRTGETESWYYSRQIDTPPVVFNFTRLNNQFSDRHYVLVRNKQYRTIWFRSIDDWRKGRK